MPPRSRSKSTPRRSALALPLSSLVLLLLAVLGPRADADTYTMGWSNVSGGGATFSTGGGWQLGGTMAQADAGPRSGGGYTLEDGYWGASPAHLTGVEPGSRPVLPAWRLAAPAPNPFHDATQLGFSLPTPAAATLEVFDVAGQRVRTLARDHFAAGDVRVRWDGAGDDGRRVRAGMYFVRLETDGRRSVQRVVMLP